MLRREPKCFDATVIRFLIVVIGTGGVFPAEDVRSDLQSRPACLLQFDWKRQSESKARPWDFSYGKAQPKVPVDIFYETQCPHCRNLFKGALQQVWRNRRLRRSMHVNLHPLYPPEFCSRDESGCWGTLLQLCAIDALRGSRKHVPFVTCMAKSGNKAGANASSRICARKLDIKMKKIRHCVNSKKSFKLLQASVNAHAKVDAKYVPWIVVNGEHVEDDALLETTCNYLSEKSRPHICSTKGSQHHRRRKKHKGCSEKSPCLYQSKDSA